MMLRFHSAGFGVFVLASSCDSGKHGPATNEGDGEEPNFNDVTEVQVCSIQFT